MGTATTESRTDAEPAALRSARTVARVLDESFRVPGTSYRIGLDPIVGLVPVAGDTLAAIASLYIVFVAAVAGLPSRAIAKMLALVGLDYVLGSVPVAGWVADAVLKANTRNVATLEAHLTSTE